MPRRIWMIAALAAASLGFQACFITLDAFHSDEGLVLVAADDVAKGRLLYRDSYVPLTPLVYLLQGVAFKLAGSDFLVSRWLMAATYAATVAAVASMAACLLPVARALWVGLAAIPFQLWIWPHAHFFSYNALSTLFCVIAMRLAWSVEARGGRARDALGLGAMLALALWTKPNLASATAAGIGVYWLLGWLRSRWGDRRTRQRGWRELARDGGAVAGGALLASAPLVAYLLWSGVLDDMLAAVYSLSRIYSDVPPGLFPALLPPWGQLDAVRLYPGRVLPGVIHLAVWNEVAFRYVVDHTGWVDLLVRLLYYTPIALLVGVAACLLRRLQGGGWDRRDEAALLLLCCSVAFFLTILPHPALHYLIPTLLPLLPLVFHAWWRLEPAGPGPRRALLRGAGAVLLLGYGAASLGALAVYLGVPREPVPTLAGTLWLPRDSARRWNEVLDYLRQQVPEQAPVFTAPYVPILHFLTRHPHPTRYVDLRPGSPGREAEDEIMLRLEEEAVEWAVYFPGAQFPGIETWRSAYPRLDHYLRSRFEPEHVVAGDLGTFAEVWRRRAGAGNHAAGKREPEL